MLNDTLFIKKELDKSQFLMYEILCIVTLFLAFFAPLWFLMDIPQP